MPKTPRDRQQLIEVLADIIFGRHDYDARKDTYQFLKEIEAHGLRRPVRPRKPGNAWP